MQQKTSAKSNKDKKVNSGTRKGQEATDRYSTSTEVSLTGESQEVRDMRELKEALLEMIDQENQPDEFQSLLSILAGVFVGSMDFENREKLFASYCPSQSETEEKMTDIELRANLLIALQNVLAPTGSSADQMEVSRKRDKKQLEKRIIKHWDAEEDKRLREGLQLYGRDLSKVAEHVGGRKKIQIYQRAYALNLIQTIPHPEIVRASKAIEGSGTEQQNLSLA